MFSLASALQNVRSGFAVVRTAAFSHISNQTVTVIEKKRKTKVSGGEAIESALRTFDALRKLT